MSGNVDKMHTIKIVHNLAHYYILRKLSGICRKFTSASIHFLFFLAQRTEWVALSILTRTAARGKSQGKGRKGNSILSLPFPAQQTQLSRSLSLCWHRIPTWDSPKLPQSKWKKCLFFFKFGESHSGRLFWYLPCGVRWHWWGGKTEGTNITDFPRKKRKKENLSYIPLPFILFFSGESGRWCLTFSCAYNVGRWNASPHLDRRRERIYNHPIYPNAQYTTAEEEEEACVCICTPTCSSIFPHYISAERKREKSKSNNRGKQVLWREKKYGGKEGSRNKWPRRGK